MSLGSWVALDIPEESVRMVLQFLADAFGWTREDALSLRPDDKLWEIYRSYYPKKHWWQRWRPDELEMETLLCELQRVAPAVNASDLHREITLGELVRLIGG